MNEQPASAAPVTTENVTGSRIVAGIIDLVVLTVLFVVMVMLFGDTSSDEDTDFSFNLSGLPGLIYIILAFGYYAVLESMGGQTLGKKVMGLKVVAIDGPLTTGKVIIRTLLRIIDGFLFYLVAIVVIASSQRKQRLGDMAAGTLVVKA